jgi:NAD(P)-dependent dehydrogenase (short-subunit alcohol dehydrogenase family)
VPPELFDLNDRVIVVTGGLGQLGMQFTRAIAEHGGRAVVLDLEVSAAKRPPLPDAIRDRVMYVAADVCNREALESALASIEQHWETPFGLINNAAIDSPPDAPAAENGPFEDYPRESWDRILAVNLSGPFVCSQVFGGRMAARGGGSIINISSIYGLVSPDQRIYEYRRAVGGSPFIKPVAYSATKSGLLNLTRYLATYWAPQSVRVNTLTLAGVFRSQDEQFLKAYLHRVPMGRMASPEEYNGAVVFLCAEASKYMTGANLVIDGGWTAW